jgi:hypothetical protein
MVMHQRGSVSIAAPNESVKRGVAAVQLYLKAHFPEHIIEVLKESGEDIARGVRTFNIRGNGQCHLLRVSDEALVDLDTSGTDRRLRTFQVARVLREDGIGKAVVLTTGGTRVEPICAA